MSQKRSSVELVLVITTEADYLKAKDLVKIIEQLDKNKEEKL